MSNLSVILYTVKFLLIRPQNICGFGQLYRIYFDFYPEILLCVVLFQGHVEAMPKL